MTAATDALGQPGTLYRVKILAVNEQGMKSDFSNEFVFVLASLPQAPHNLRKDDQKSNGEQIALLWDEITGETIDVLGYKLYANTGRNDPLRLVYDGSTNPQATSFEFNQAINAGELVDYRLVYRFQVSAVNYNGEGALSDVVELKSCTMPSRMVTPIVTVPGINRQVEVEWFAPEESGGCPLQSYHLYLKDLSETSTWTEIDQLTIRNNTYLRSHTIDMSSGFDVQYYVVKVTVDNAVGTAESDSVVFLLADVPA